MGRGSRLIKVHTARPADIFSVVNGIKELFSSFQAACLMSTVMASHQESLMVWSKRRRYSRPEA